MPISDKFRALIEKPTNITELDKQYTLPEGGVNTLFKLEEEYNLPSGVLLSVVNKETGGLEDRSKAVSPKGAKGWFQFMPDTAKAFDVNTEDFHSSATGAAKMFSTLNKQYEGDIDKMLAAYNWGSGNIAKKGMEKAPRETRDYINKVKSMMRGLPKITGNYMPKMKVPEKEPPSDWKFPLNLISPSMKKQLGFDEM